MAENFSFQLVPEILVQGRNHEGQDTRMLRDTVVRNEGAALHERFVRTLKVEDFGNVSSEHIAIMYKNLAIALVRQDYIRAAQMATKLSHQYEAPQSLWRYFCNRGVFLSLCFIANIKRWLRFVLLRVLPESMIHRMRRVKTKQKP